MPSKKEHKLISKNRSAHHEYFIDETIECGVELAGVEVKSIRERACQITDTFAIIRGGECWLVGLHIHPYSNGGVWNRDPDRRKKLLLHRKEIDYLDGKLRNRGYALVPLELYFNDSGRVKLLLGNAHAVHQVWAAARSSMTSAKIWPSAMCSGRSTEPSKHACAAEMPHLGTQSSGAARKAWYPPRSNRSTASQPCGCAGVMATSITASFGRPFLFAQLA